jgi:hypothetical protein
MNWSAGYVFVNFVDAVSFANQIVVALLIFVNFENDDMRKKFEEKIRVTLRARSESFIIFDGFLAEFEP